MSTHIAIALSLEWLFSISQWCSPHMTANAPGFIWIVPAKYELFGHLPQIDVKYNHVWTHVWYSNSSEVSLVGKPSSKDHWFPAHPGCSNAKPRISIASACAVSRIEILRCFFLIHVQKIVYCNKTRQKSGRNEIQNLSMLCKYKSDITIHVNNISQLQASNIPLH